jgi:membrane fusion protein (multidrug efflux system)
MTTEYNLLNTKYIRMSKTTKIILFSIIALLIIGMVLYPAVKKHFNGNVEVESRLSPQGGKGNPLPVNVKIIRPETLTDVIQATGSLIPDEEVSLTFEAPGKITRIYFQEGALVQKGTLLAKVNDQPLQAELQKLQAQIPLAEDRVFRQKALLEKDAVSKEAYEQVTTELEKLKADIDLVQSRIAQTELRAPFDGEIGLRSVSEGAYASPTTLVAHLTKITPLKIEFSVPERYANVIRPGTKITFKTSSELTEYPASVYALESQIDLNTRTLKARALYPNAYGKLKPGETASIIIQSNEIKQALTAPSESIIKEMGRDIAYVYSQGKARLVELAIGIRTESHLQILDGLTPGDTLIISGVMQLRDGIPVNIDNIN